MKRRRYHHLQKSISNYLLDSNKVGGRAPKLILKNWEILLGILEEQEKNVVDETDYIGNLNNGDSTLGAHSTTPRYVELNPPPREGGDSSEGKE